MLKFKSIGTLLIGVSLSLFAFTPVQAASYKVTQGDSLFTIGKLFYTNSNDLIKNNNLKNSNIYPGQTLNVPADIYTVKNGDSLYFIAKKYGITTDQLKKANDKWDNTIYSGQKLNVPAANTSYDNNVQAVSTTKNSNTNSVISYNNNDLDLLARLVMSESQGQPYKAEVGVAAVVVNRVKSSEFPNSISSVIYQKSDNYYQFTPVQNGWINKAASDEAKKAALDALQGYDPTNGAIYYFDDSATNSWLWSRPITLRSGKMVFTH